MTTEPLIHGRRKKSLLALVAAAVLGAGYLAAPPRPTPASEERVAPILEQEIEQRDPVRLLRGAQETGRRVAAHVVEVRTSRPSLAPEAVADVAPGSPPATGGFGVLLGGGRVLTHLDALDGDLEPIVGDGERRGRVLAADGATGLALVAVAGEAETGAVVAAVPPSAGTPAIGVARPRGSELVAPLIVAAVAGDRLTLSAASGIRRAGTPVFSTAGEALAIAAGPRDPSAAFLITPVLARMEGLPAGSGASTIGVALQALSGPLSRALGSGGVAVADVRAGSPAAAAGIRPADVLVAVAGAPAIGVEEARAAIARLVPGTEAEIVIRRKEETVPLAVRAALWRAAPEPPAEAGLPLEALVSTETIAALGLPPGTRILSVDGASPPARPAAVAAWQRRKALSVLQLSSGDDRFLVAVEPGP